MAIRGLTVVAGSGDAGARYRHHHSVFCTRTRRPLVHMQVIVQIHVYICMCMCMRVNLLDLLLPCAVFVHACACVCVCAWMCLLPACAPCVRSVSRHFRSVPRRSNVGEAGNDVSPTDPTCTPFRAFYPSSSPYVLSLSSTFLTTDYLPVCEQTMGPLPVQV